MTIKTETLDEASSSALIVKDAILARSGIYVYSYDEMVRRGHVPETKKEFYKEYRPASVLAAAKDKFRYATLTKEHPHKIDSSNVKDVFEGVVGSNIEVVVLENDEVALKGEIAFFTKDAVAYYHTGGKETSAQYISKVSSVIGEDYDYILEEIKEVQGLALTRQGRGGSSVAVLDSLISADLKSADKKIQGDKVMSSKNSILSFFGIGKAPQDELSSLVIDSLSGYNDISETEKKARRDKVDLIINSLPDSPEKKILVDTVKDCFAYPKEVLEKTNEVSNGLKSLYKLCVKGETVSLQTTLDSIKKEKEEDDEDEEKKTKDAEAKKKEEEKAAEEKKKKEEAEKGTKDSIVLDEKTMESFLTRVIDSLSPKMDALVKKHLGIEDEKSSTTKDSVLPSFSSETTEQSFLLDGMFK